MLRAPETTIEDNLMETNQYAVLITESIGKGNVMTYVKGPFGTYKDAWQFGVDWKDYKHACMYQVHKLVPVRVRSGVVIKNSDAI